MFFVKFLLQNCCKCLNKDKKEVNVPVIDKHTGNDNETPYLVRHDVVNLQIQEKQQVYSKLFVNKIKSNLGSSKSQVEVNLVTKKEFENTELNQSNKKDFLTITIKSKSENQNTSTIVEVLNIHKNDNLGDIFYGVEGTQNKIHCNLKLNDEVVKDIPIFKTFYNIQTKKFYIQVLENSPNCIVQVKLNTEKNRWILNPLDKFIIGDLNFKFEPNDDEITIIRKESKAFPQQNIKTFKSSEGIITIGRAKNLKFTEESKAMSRINAHVIYNESLNKWELGDGTVDQKPSTNGCIVFTTNPIEITDKIEMKVGASDTIYFESNEQLKYLFF